MKPVPVTVSTVWLVPKTSSPAPAEIAMGEAAGRIEARVVRSTPPVTEMPAPPRLSEPLRARVPSPALVSPVMPAPAAEVTVPERVETTFGWVMLMVRPEAPRLTGPARMRPEPTRRPPNSKLPSTVTALCSVRTVLSEKIEVPALTVSVPVPKGPLVMTGKSELAPMMSPPAERSKPVVNVLSALSKAMAPAPALTIGPVMPTFWVIAELMRKPVGASPAFTVMTGLAAENCRRVRAASEP